VGLGIVERVAQSLGGPDVELTAYLEHGDGLLDALL
jgi:hypothetical protein